jgi:hypothetical protein
MNELSEAFYANDIDIFRYLCDHLREEIDQAMEITSTLHASLYSVLKGEELAAVNKLIGPTCSIHTAKAN